MVHARRARDTRPPNCRVGEAERKLLLIGAELPLQRRPLALAKQVGLVEPEEAADSSSLTHRRSEVDAAGALLLHREYDVDVALLAGGPSVRRRQRRLEEPEVGDVLIAANQSILVEHVTRED